MTDQSNLPQSQVLVTGCTNCPFAVMRGKRVTCLLADHTDLAVMLFVGGIPTQCVLKFGPVVVKLAERRPPVGVGREQLAEMLKAIEEDGAKGAAA